MARTMTLSDAATRFANLATTGIGIEAAIQEAVDRVYEMGRWPGTTREVVLDEEDFIEDADLKQHFVYFDEDVYDGAIGFRNDSRGWSIVDHTALYKDGVNMGDREFVDMGTVEVEEGEETVSKRKYRCPLGWSPSSGPYYALIKLESPVMVDETVIPIQSVGALKCAIQAVNYEYVSDEDRANVCWQKFDAFIKGAERQTHGPKRFTLGMDSSLKRKPRQFQ